ncbi:hypothetical protein AB691_2626 [Stutzerimonas stutzeri]|nr:hypothetical protein AB691_2626 [Stutzerimonas stutzeri]
MPRGLHAFRCLGDLAQGRARIARRILDGYPATPVSIAMLTFSATPSGVAA